MSSRADRGRGKTMKAFALVALFVMAAAAPAGTGEISFSAKPTATKDGEKVKISFTVSAPTDAAVFVENAQGKIVRHLVAGVLGGANPPPEPLKPGLAQTVEWDGRADYGKPCSESNSALLQGKPAEGGPFKVRVALGLGAKYDKVLSSRPTSFAGQISLAVAPDGTLYARVNTSDAIFGHCQIVALNRDGSYRRTLMPFPATADGKEGRGLPVMELDGRTAPVKSYAGDISSWGGPLLSSMAVSPDGKTLYSLSGGILRLATELGSADGHASIRLPDKVGALPFKGGFANEACLAIASDGKSLFFTGLKADQYDNKKLAGAVYRVKLPECAEIEAFFGEPGKPGSDQTHLGATPAGLDCDGKGNLLIADPANKRVVAVSESDGKFQGELKVDRGSLHGLGVDRKTGAVFGCFKEGVVKYSGWKDGQKVADLPIRLKGWYWPSRLAVDSSGDRAVVWISWGDAGQLVRAEDLGGKFDIKEISPGWRDGAPDECYVGMVVDRLTKEVYARNGAYGGRLERVDDATGKVDAVYPAGAAGNGQGWGFQYTPGPNGNIYGMCWEHKFAQWDRTGKPVAWTEPRIPTPEELKSYDYDKVPSKAPHVAYVAVAMCAQPHGLGVRWSDGHLFVIEPRGFTQAMGGRTMKALHEFLPSGKRITTETSPVIWKLSDAAVGPKFDAAGNIYVAEALRPKGWQLPAEIRKHLEARGVKGPQAQKEYINLYGSIVKFSPKGGMVHWPTRKGDVPPINGPDPFDGEPKLDPGLKSFEAECIGWGQISPVKITGAEWIHPGIGNVGFLRCNCENVTFDVDEFGRTFFADLSLFKVRAIDAGGNAVASFGSYGNPENCGPDSPVIDPTTKQLRPRRPDDPKDLKSPFAEPEIALAHPASVGATDKHLYIGDASNRRLLRCKLVYAAEESCTVP
jgi:hypothetical protein